MVSTIITWRDRKELPLALPSLVSLADRLGGEVAVVNFGGDPALVEAQIRPWRDAVRLIGVADQPYFNKSCAQNVGVASTVHPLLFFCDCDIVIDADAVAALAKRVACQEGCFGTLAKVQESTTNSRNGHHVVRFGYELNVTTADGRTLSIVDHEEDAEDGTRHAPGLLLVRRSDFRAVGGYNSRLHGWGWEDQDMISRLILGAGLTRVTDGGATHLSHDDAARVGAYPCADRWESRDRMFRQALRNYDRRDFHGTYQADVHLLAAVAAGDEA
jgi:hypothetical protein